VDNVLPERPESEEMICEDDEEADDYTVSGAIATSGSTAKGYCNHGLREIQKEVLYRDPEQKPQD
jgi:hypothetical protein